ncbi:MAG: hypothetical protein HWE24_01265 [Oceanospirillaceae bacterium]|nr:hypothetical protein [Oceanospirillaceae bacterium]
MVEIETEYKDKIYESGELLKDYESACEWISSLGIDYRPTRFKSYLDDTKLLFNENAKGVDEYSTVDELKDVVRRYLNASREIHELLRIVNALKRVEDNDSFLDQLRKTASGNAGRLINHKDQSRNFSFELDVASRFIFAGFEVDLTGTADLRVLINGKNLYVECKRVTSMKQLGKRIKSANQQLLRRLKRDSSKQSRGLVAVEVSHLVDFDESIWGYKTNEDLWNASAEIINSFVRNNEDDFNKGSTKRLLGVLAQITFPSFISDENGLKVAAARSSTLLMYKNSQSDSEFLDEFWEKLGNQVDYMEPE